VTFGREKRLLLGLVALLAPLPLSFNEILEWPVLALYMVTAGLFLRRAAGDPAAWLPGWALNVLGLAYLPVLYLDLAVLWGGQLVRPVIHLALFAVAVKLFALRGERDKWHVTAGAFFLFLTSMATSVHPSILAYLVVMMVLFLWLLIRFSYFSTLARFGHRRSDLAQVPLRAFVAASALGALLAAVPLFAVLPRVRAPFIMAPGGGTGTVIHASGFSDVVSLSGIGTIRESRKVLLRLAYEPENPQREVRLKAATYELYLDQRWRRSMPEGALPREIGSRGLYLLGHGRPRQQVEVWMEPLGTDALPVPVEAVSLEIAGGAVRIDRGGALSLVGAPPGKIHFTAQLGEQPLTLLAAPPAPAELEPALDLRGVTARMARLAEQIAGGGSASDQAARLETYLSTQLEYTTELLGRRGVEPLEAFLFEARRGHCELFASSMVLLLRSQGIPARLVTGFLGAEANPFEGYFVVRRSNAHAWVEAYLPEAGGWVTFDPTPPAGRPLAQDPGLALLLQQMYDYMLFRWDRYVLTFGFQDQMELFSRLRRAWREMWQVVRRPERGPQTLPSPGAEDGLAATSAGARGPVDWWHWGQGGMVLFFALVLSFAVFLWWRQRQPLNATEGYRELRRQLLRAGLKVPPSLPPLALERSARSRYPEVADDVRHLLAHYLRESFAGVALGESERREVRARLQQVKAGLGGKRAARPVG
jgi:protein-glutamine gamma-glutamyltransferase